MKTKLLIALVTICTFANAQYTKLLDFAGTTDGRGPEYGALITDGTFLYGMTRQGGTYNFGVIFKIKPDGTGYVKLFDFDGPINGRSPYGSLYSDGTYLYGMTQLGGANSSGVIFKILPDGTNFTKLLDFAGSSNGAAPYGSLISDGTFLYGTTAQGGVGGFGVVFKIKPDGTGYLKLYDFAGFPTDGSYPRNSLISDGTFLYGMTYQGGVNNKGVIYKIKPDGTDYAKLLEFAGTLNGANPVGSLISDGTFLYGVTIFGGTSDMGVVFKILTDGTGYTNIKNFTAVDERQPYGHLASDGGFLYGTTYFGGTFGGGAIFKIKTDGTDYAKLYDFSASMGGNPLGSLMFDGIALYGMTSAGGTSNYGVVFKYQTSFTGLVENNTATGFSIYPNPFSIHTSLQSDNFLHNATLTVDNSFGQTVKQIKNISGQTVTISRDNLPSGLYFVRLVQDNQVITTKKLLITD